MANYYGYCRVSSSQQGKKGTISEQIKPVAKYLLHHGVSKKSLDKYIYKDTYTGMTMNRPSFNKLMKKIKDGDIVVVYRLDRLSRDGLNAMNFIKKHPHVTFHIIRPSMDVSAEDKTSTKFLHDLLIIFAQYDHDLTMQKFNDGKARIKSEIKAGKIKPYNYNGGMPKRFYNANRRGYYESIYKYTFTHSLSETARIFNIAKSTAMRIKRAGKEYHRELEQKGA